MLTVKTEERAFGGVRYRVTQLGAELASDLLFVLLRAIGAGAQSLSLKGFNIAAALKSLELADFRSFREAFAAQTAVLVEDKAKKAGVTARWMPLSSVGGVDQQFAGKPRELLDWMRWSFELNFGSFFGDPEQAAPAPDSESPAPSESDSPPASTGTSGASSRASASP